MSATNVTAEIKANEDTSGSKNIVLCADGTGNRGGKGQCTNVWRIYQAVDQHKKNSAGQRKQIAFYDDGVGTEDNKILRLIGGATGFGFTRNVKDLYKFLVKNYVVGDDIYMFGFSRGAYTVRALAAFVTVCGVIKDARTKSEQALDDDIEKLIAAYAARQSGAAKVGASGVTMIHPAPIKCVGVWDTVSAIGVPFDIGLKALASSLFKFKFRDQDLNPNVKHGFHALAIDDQRKSFHPMTWNQRHDVEQVWFAGAHSNVGGGYPKQGMAHVPLDWMMDKVEYDPSDPSKNGSAPDEKQWGLYFHEGLRDAARHHANVHDKLYDPRSGLAAYYRYEPRDIEKLSAKGAVQIHDSVLDRIRARTLGYSPGNIPAVSKFEAVTTDERPVSKRRAEGNSAIGQHKKIVERHDTDLNPASIPIKTAKKWVVARKALQFVFFALSLVIAGSVAKYAAAAFGINGALRYIIDGALFLVLVAIVVDAKSWIVDETAVKITQWVAAAVFVAFILFEGAHLGAGGGETEMPAFVTTVLGVLLDASGILHPAILLDFIAENPMFVIVMAGLLLFMWWLKRYFRNELAALYEVACDALRPARQPVSGTG